MGGGSKPCAVRRHGPAAIQSGDFFPVNVENSAPAAIADPEAGSQTDHTPVRDLFGNPLRPMKDPRGRKAYSKSKENQDLVIDLRAGGLTHAEIATVLGCDEKTLRKYYSRELHEGAILVQAEAIRVMMHKMRTGNMAATRAVLEMASLHGPAVKRPRGPDPRSGVGDGAPGSKVGKKVLLEKAAGELPTGWSDLLGDGTALN